MFDFFKKLFTHKPIKKDLPLVISLIKFPPENSEYFTKELCRERISIIDGVSDCHHCLPEASYDLIVFANWDRSEIKQNIELIRNQLPADVDIRWQEMVPVKTNK